MATVNARTLIDRLNPTCRRALEAAAGLCLSRSHYHVEVEHWLLKLLEAPDADLPVILRQYDLDAGRVVRELDRTLDQFQTGNARAPDLSLEVIDLVREAWFLASLESGAANIRSGDLLTALVTDRALGPRICASAPELDKLPRERLQKEVPMLLARSSSVENAQAAVTPGAAPLAGGGAAPAPGKLTQTPALDQFTQNLTERAQQGGIDPVVGRDAEIRQVVNILMARRQNNPILTGAAGVGKTAVVEGLALRIARGDVPDPLKNVVLRVLDLGLLQAGAGVKGEFENRLKNVLAEVKGSPRPVVLFIDEAHTMIGAGGMPGQSDAANLLKPALARGELRTIAATTFAEYKKYFATDAALARRFQVVKVEEPDEVKAVRMLRGLVPMLEKHHGVRILEEALADTVRLSTRYIPERQLPDKAVSLLDKVCARVALSQSATPPTLEDALREVEHLSAEIAFVTRDAANTPEQLERLQELTERKEAAEARLKALEVQLEKEKKLAAKVRELRKALDQAGRSGASASLAENLRAELAKAQAELAGVQGESPLIHPVVDGAAVAELVSGLTGIPLGKMVRDEVQTVLNLDKKLRERVIGQDHALKAIAQRIATARADLVDPRRPIAVFLLVGPSGVGKTETAVVLADLLYGGDRNMVVINMSEYKESHKVSRLTGTAPGYVGYGEGGVLTNAVKQKPYSIVLLDEVEKADESVQEIFYQVFDKGTLQNDVGEEINFKNTIIFLTSNVGTDVIVKACADPDTVPDVEGLNEILRPALLKTFKPALLGRMTVVPYFPLSEPVLRQITELQLKKVGGRLRQNHKAAFSYDPEVVAAIVSRCKEVESGARNVDHILTGTMLPAISRELLTRMAEGRTVGRVRVGVNQQGEFTYAFE